MRQNNYKRAILAISFLVIAGLIMSIMVGCDLLGLSIEKRVEYFLTDLNTNRGNAYTNFHPTETAERVSGAINPASFWDIDFPIDDGTPYMLSSIDDSNPLNVQVVVNGPPAFGGGTQPLRFVMIADGTNWLIEELWYWVGSDIVQ